MKWKGKINFETRPEVNSYKIFSEGSNEFTLVDTKPTISGGDLIIIEDASDGYSKKVIDWGTIQGDSTEIIGVQARRTTPYDLPATYSGTITYDETDWETNSAVLDHDYPTNASKICIKEDGYYLIGFNLSGVEFSADGSTETHVNGRVIKNGSIPLAGSEAHGGNYYSLTNDISEPTFIMHSFISYLEYGDCIEVQAEAEGVRPGTTGFTAQTTEDIVFWAIRMKILGPPGERGIAGSGSTINVYKDGAGVAGTPFEVLNFIGGATVSGNPTISGGVDIAWGINVEACQAYYAGAPVTFDSGTGWTTFTYDTTVVETNSAKIYHGSGANSDKIYTLEDGVYHVGFFTEGDPAGDTACSFRILKSGVAQQSVQTYMDSAGVSDTFHCDYLITCSGGDYLQIQADPDTQDIDMHNSTFYVYRVGSGRDGLNGATGPEGPQGPAGSGSTINVYSDGTSVSGTPFEVLNFIGGGATISGSATVSGGVDISISGVIKQIVRKNITTEVTTNSVISPASAPLYTAGTAFNSHSITLQQSDSTVRVQGIIPCATDNVAGTPTAFIYRGTTVLAVSAVTPGKDYLDQLAFDFYDTPGSVGPHTYYIRVGVRANNGYFNRTKNTATPYGGKAAANCWLSLTEIGA